MGNIPRYVYSKTNYTILSRKKTGAFIFLKLFFGKNKKTVPAFGVPLKNEKADILINKGCQPFSDEICFRGIVFLPNL